MRRSVLSAVLAAGLSLVACSDQPTEVAPGELVPAPPGSAAVVGCPTNTTLAQLVDLVNQLVQPGPVRTAINKLVNKLPTKLEDRIKAAARNQIFLIQDAILKAFYAGLFIGGTSPQTFDKVLNLIRTLYCYVGLTPPTFPTPTAGSDIVVRVLFPNVAFDFSTPAGEAGLKGGAGAVTTAMGPVLITISDLPDTPPPLRTSLDQYPRFYLFHGTTATGAAVEFNEDVIAATCLRDGLFFGNTNNLRLAHNVGPTFGDVEVLPRSTVIPTGVTCPPPVIGSTGGGAEGRFAWASKLLLPAELHATSTALVELPVGGTTKKFSEFGIVDITSNPAPQGRNPNDATFTGLTALPLGTVTPPSVKLTSQKGDPIPLWPVVFTVTGGGGTLNGDVLTTVTVLTGADGTASVSSWKLGAVPGVNTISVAPTPVLQSPAAPAATQAFKPAGVANPASLAFMATGTAAPTPGADIVVFNDLNMFDNTAAADPNNLVLYANLVSYTGTGTRASNTRVLVHRGHSVRCFQPVGNQECSPTGWYTFENTMRTVGGGYTVDDVDDASAPLTTIAANVKVLILALPTTAYSAAEINAMKAFAGEGGRIVFVGEYQSFYGAGIAVENDFLTSMGAVMTNTGGAVDCADLTGYKVLPSTSLRSHQITGGLTQLTIACASVVLPGPDDYPLFYDRSGGSLLGAVAKVDLTPIPIILLRAVEVAPTSTQSAALSNDAAGRGVVSKP